MTREEIIVMAREAGVGETSARFMVNLWEIGFEAGAAAKDAEHAEKLKNDIHSCGPTCTRYACVAVREAVEAEREACAKVCDALAEGWKKYPGKDDSGFIALSNAGVTIRARKDNT